MTQIHQVPIIMSATIGTKGQIVIPKEAREKLNVQAGDRVVLLVEDGRMAIINPDGLQHMIELLQESAKYAESTETSKKKSDSKHTKKTSKKK